MPTKPIKLEEVEYAMLCSIAKTKDHNKITNVVKGWINEKYKKQAQKEQELTQV